MPAPRARWALAALLALGASGTPVGIARADERASTACLMSDVPVAPPLTLAVRTCVPAAGALPRGVQVLVHGAITDHRYWDLPGSGGANSWEAAALAAGWATVAMDRPGSGGSTHPPSAAVTLDANAAAVSALARSLRAGRVPAARGPFRPTRVVLVGHSLGSGVAALAATRFGDADALILTGYSHYQPEPYSPAVFAAALQPAALDPGFAGLDPGYLTTRPGTRGFLFAPGTDVADGLAAHDEATKGTVTSGELATGGLTQRMILAGVTVPVLLVTGDRDGLFCSQAPGDLGADCSSGATLAAGERRWFPAAPSVSAVVVPGAGHMLNAFRSAPATFAAAMSWLSRSDLQGRSPGRRGETARTG